MIKIMSFYFLLNRRVLMPSLLAVVALALAVVFFAVCPIATATFYAVADNQFHLKAEVGEKDLAGNMVSFFARDGGDSTYTDTFTTAADALSSSTAPFRYGQRGGSSLTATGTSRRAGGGSRELAVASPAFLAPPVLSYSQDAFECSDGVDFVDCAGGYLVGSSNTVSCATACEGNCCTGTNACFLFTGKVCKDGSCDGMNACAYAIIPLVVNSCKNSSFQCYMAGSGGQGSYIAGMKNSCNGMSSCQHLGMGSAVGGGKVGYVLDSCNGSYGCLYAGNSGTIGSLKNSCNGERACNDLAQMGGKSGNIQDSCNAGYSCDGVAKSASIIGDIASSCNAFQACQLMTGTNSTNLFSCCNLDNECKSKNAITLPAQCSLTANPSSSPSKTPTVQPLTVSPSSMPSSPSPSNASTSSSPSSSPTNIPSANPTTSSPTYMPTTNPSGSPTGSPTANPTNVPIIVPTSTSKPTNKPSLSKATSTTPSMKPSRKPTMKPSMKPSMKPTKLKKKPTKK